MTSTEGINSDPASSGPPSDPSSTKAGQIWLRDERPRRKRLTRGRIVDAAMELLDAQGIERLTMRRLAEHLGVGATTLYGHVTTKDDVLDLALDAVYAQSTPPTGGSTNWKAEIEDVMHEWRSALLRHPWSAHLLGRPHLGPCMLARQDALLASLAHAGFTAEKLNDADYALSNYVIGSVLMQVAWQEQAPASRDAATAHIRAHADHYPHLAHHRLAPDTDWDRSFSNGLTFLIDGLAANAEGA